jgi:hypothetical protein
MWLVVCQDGDVDARAAIVRLREHGLAPVELVTATQLVHGARWEHRVGAGGAARTRVTLADGRTIDSAELRGVLNRLLWVSAEGYLGASEADREYAGGELYALVQSWLASLGRRVVNRPGGSGLAGPWLRPCQWRWEARAAGLRIRPVPEDEPAPLDGGRVLVVDGAVADAGGAPEGVGEGCVRLARALGLDVVEMRFDEDWSFADASLVPALAVGAAARLDAVAAALRERGA